uniref:Cytochrome c oxidase subunit 2 n=1 Tax=Setaphyes kielensis TaxID=3298910 RepID=A0A1I9VTT5_9BILA|nr:cytochrome c oxidase subunit II [Pycnophyes kielensis]APA17408.1 cytochrome c oxidase subunit 2 [Pycnophyes kielensis]
MLFYGGIWLQNPSTYICSNMVVFFNYLCLLITLISGLVGFWMWKTMVFNSGYRSFLDHEYLEIWWTTVPVLVMFLIGVPSIRILYMWDCQPGASMSLKIEGHQWYWEYEYAKMGLNFDSFMYNLSDFSAEESKDIFRLLEVDNRVVLPGEVSVRLLMSSLDVLHSWAVPSMGVKVDCIPGRLNSMRLSIPMSGVFYGQCSELCGVGHGVMPIVVEVVSCGEFEKFIGMTG